ncbi:TetR family transcriptional regulator [Nakamurella antarctica]|uniref:TetR family transcriptional regulator n=1 Tax=Nakamurella antarctica TaxID=1902245 RepID=A0A3G8ZUL4_9ACTN|nr:TetR family transcriptional regulator [Nakamurella antarctica]AZI57411.1 TetR family transcriptional regulator [Nakamurella antarctica]
MSEEDKPAAAPRRPGRPAKALLTQADIARGALAIIDEKGWHNCTMKALAQSLGVRSPSLYHHIDGQGALVSLVRALIVTQIHDPTIVDLPWDEAIRRFAIAYYRVFSAHPNTIQVLSTTPVRDADTVGMYETFVRVFVGGGGEIGRALGALIELENLALGFAYAANAEEVLLDPSFVETFSAPLLAEATRSRTDQDGVSETSFLGLLNRYIDILRRDFEDAAVHAFPHHPMTSTDSEKGPHS